MKKFSLYAAFSALCITALVMIGFVVVAFLSVRLDASNERLSEREEERSALEDKWIDYHDIMEDKYE